MSAPQPRAVVDELVVGRHAAVELVIFCVLPQNNLIPNRRLAQLLRTGVNFGNH